MPTLELETMRCELDGHLARLRFNRPEALNAANWTWVQDLVSATNYLSQSAGTRVVIVSGEGRSFCSGLDTKELARGNLPIEWFETWERGVTALSNLKAISIAAIHGYCLGGGLQVALACDLRIAATNAVLSIPAVREGVIAALGPMRLARLIGAGPAKQLCLLGHRFTPAEGYALSIINEVVDLEKLEERALSLAHELLDIPFTALLHTKEQIDAAFDQDTAAHMTTFITAQQDCLRSPEHAAVMVEYREQLARRSNSSSKTKEEITMTEVKGTKEQPWGLKTPSGTSEYTMYKDETHNPPILVCTVGKTVLHYDLRCIHDLQEMLKKHGDWIELGSADEQKPAKEGTVEAWGRSPNNPLGGWYGLKKGLRGRFGMYIPPLMEELGLVELEHNPKNNRMRAK